MVATLNQPAPDFTLQDQDDKSHSLSEYRGKWLLLYFYPEDDTAGCTKEACNFRDSYAQNKVPDYLQVVGISGDSVASHDAFAKKYGLNFTLLAVSEKKTIGDYGIRTVYKKRSSFLIDPDGIIRKIYDGVEPESHVEEVMRDMQVMA